MQGGVRGIMDRCKGRHSSGVSLAQPSPYAARNRERCCAELMVGGSLSDAMRMHRTFTLRRAMEVAIDTARGLAYMHAKKNGAIIHR